jgi:hypothetical protein
MNYDGFVLVFYFYLEWRRTRWTRLLMDYRFGVWIYHLWTCDDGGAWLDVGS